MVSIFLRSLLFNVLFYLVLVVLIIIGACGWPRRGRPPDGGRGRACS